MPRAPIRVGRITVKRAKPERVGQKIVDETLPKQRAVSPDPKLAKVRVAMAANDWNEAIKLAARVTLFGKHAEAIQRGKEAIANPDFYRQLGRDPDKLRLDAIAALKERIAAIDAVASEREAERSE